MNNLRWNILLKVSNNIALLQIIIYSTFIYMVYIIESESISELNDLTGKI